MSRRDKAIRGAVAVLGLLMLSFGVGIEFGSGFGLASAGAVLLLDTWSGASA